jgi:hypothetical protein
MAPTKKNTTIDAAVRLTHAGQTLSWTKTAISRVANEYSNAARWAMST